SPGPGAGDHRPRATRPDHPGPRRRQQRPLRRAEPARCHVHRAAPARLPVRDRAGVDRPGPEAERMRAKLLVLLVGATLLASCDHPAPATSVAAHHGPSQPPSGPSTAPPPPPGDTFGLPADIIARIPHFPPSPTPEPVTVP